MRSSSTCPGGEIYAAEGGRLGRGSGTPRHVWRQGRRRRWSRQAANRRPRAQHTQGTRATTHRVRRVGRKLARGMAARLGTRCHVLQNNVPQARAEVQLVVGGGRHATATGGERVRGARVGGCAGRRGSYAGGPSPAAPLAHSLSVIRRDVVAPSPESPESPPRVPAGSPRQGGAGGCPDALARGPAPCGGRPGSWRGGGTGVGGPSCEACGWPAGGWGTKLAPGGMRGTRRRMG